MPRQRFFWKKGGPTPKMRPLFFSGNAVSRLDVVKICPTPHLVSHDESTIYVNYG